MNETIGNERRKEYQIHNIVFNRGIYLEIDRDASPHFLYSKISLHTTRLFSSD